jgi:hypothetical protein
MNDAERRVLGISAVTATLYLATWLLEGSLACNGGSAAGFFALYTSATLLIFWAYGALISMSRRGRLQGRARLWALLVPVLFSLVFLAWVPKLSQDTLSYLAHGVLSQAEGRNPLLEPVQAARDTSLGAELIARGWQTAPGVTPYGILWTRFEGFVVSLSGTNVGLGVLLFKVIAVLASLGTAGLIWHVLGHINPAIQLEGTLAYLWNPLVLTEFAVEGHNDAVMIFFSLAALAAVVVCRPAVSLIVQCVGALSKYVCSLFLLPQLVLLWRSARTPNERRRLALQAGIAALVIAALLMLLYAPFWVGVHSLDGLLKRTYPFGSATFFGVSRWALKHTALRAFSGPMTTVLVASLLLALIAWCSLRVRDAMGFAKSCAWISLAFLLVVSPDYWPWYACMAIAWICVGDLKRLFWLVILLSIVGRLTGPLDVLRIEGHLGRELSKALITGMGSLLPLLALLLWVINVRLRRSGSTWFPKETVP